MSNATNSHKGIGFLSQCNNWANEWHLAYRMMCIRQSLSASLQILLAVAFQASIWDVTLKGLNFWYFTLLRWEFLASPWISCVNVSGIDFLLRSCMSFNPMPWFLWTSFKKKERERLRRDSVVRGRQRCLNLTDICITDYMAIRWRDLNDL